MTVLAPLMLVGCLKDEVTPFPAGLEPLEDCTAEWPGAGTDDTPQGINVVHGQDDDWRWASGCGYFDADVATVWAALQDADVITDRREVSDWEVTESGHEPEYDVSFRVWNFVENIINVDYTIDWRQGVWEEDDDGVVQSVVARWQKTDGVAVIELLEGSIVVEATDDGGSSISVVEHLEAIGYEPEDLAQYLQDLHASIVAHAAGQDLPDWEE